MKLFFIITFLLAVTFVLGEKVNYSGYKIVRIFPKNKEEWKATQSWQSLGANPILEHKDRIDFLIPPHLAADFLDGMRGNAVDFKTIFEDVQSVIDAQKVNTEPIVDGSLEWDQYYKLSDIHQFLEDQAAKHPNIAETFSVGSSYEGREMKAIKISKSNETKPAIWIDAVIHAREWISGAVCTFIIDQILNGNDTEVQAWLDEYDFYVIPIYNVDGYEFSHTTDRFWRKSRSDNGSPQGCLGTDLNRNFDFHWLENGGASPVPCHILFAGTEVWSDIESVNVRDFLTTISPRLKFYLSLHSAGQFILFPTGLDAVKIPQYNTYMNLTKLAAEAHAQRYGTIFTPGSSFDEMYVATGTTMDWVKDALNPTLTLTYELRDKGQWGHVLPPDQILPSSLEFMDGLKVLISELTKGIPEIDP